MPIDCEDIIRNALGRNMTEVEVGDFFEEARRLMRGVRGKKSAAEKAAEAQAKAAQWAKRQELAALGRKRATELQQARRMELARFCLGEFKGMEAEGLRAALGGVQRVRQGSRLSADAIGAGLEGYYMSGLLNDLEGLGKSEYKLIASGKYDLDIARAMWAIDNPNGVQYNGSDLGRKAGEIIHKWSETARVDENAAGAWINKLPGYIVRQSHDPDRMVLAGKDKWKDFIRDKLDWERTAEGKYDPAVDPVAAETFLDNVYNNLITGVHFTSQGSNVNPLTQASVTGTTAAKVSHNRVLHFKDGDSWFHYNNKFGNGNLRESVLVGLRQAARNTALMRVMGPSPLANFQNVLRDIEEALARRADVEGIRRLRKERHSLDNLMKELDGTIDMTGNPTLALAGRFARTWENMTKLGGATISGLSDVPTFAYEFAYHGKSFTKSLFEGIAMSLKGRGSLEQRRILSSLGVFFDSMSAGIASRFTGDQRPGRLMQMQNVFFKLNLMNFHTDTWRKCAGLMLSHDLAQDAGTAWNGLRMEQRRVLSLYGIDEGIWEMTRHGKMRAADGRDYFTPEVAREMKLKDIEAYFSSKGMVWSEALGKDFRSQVENMYRAYFRDRVQYAVLEPDARTRSITYQGLNKGTPMGEALRCAMQFKSFTTAFMQRIMGREIYGRGKDTLGRGLLQNLWGGKGNRGNLFNMLAMMTLFGYAAMSVKQLIAGYSPRDPADPKTWAAALVQGGGMGIIGDFMFGESSRMGSTFLSTLAGPTASSIEGFYNLYTHVRDGQDARAEAVRTTISNTPFNNLFWIKPALDYYMLNNIYEDLNPGYLRRMIRRKWKENKQTFWHKPASR